MTETTMEDQVKESLMDVIDPELGIDIVNLGLIYKIDIIDGNCIITMTLTTMGCPLGDYLHDEITDAAKLVDGVNTVEINLVWEPAWDLDMASRFAKISLGIYDS
ncbi:metal-sulfur cluster assembly factor [Companilactobacillus sp. HBUAS59699]|uniref:metal-sulfur cluster assembly factor n=1 Tax=Companilactobacillus sp. HBUAS59699 TaxID=3109358 RepID=UPI002FF1FBD9